MTDHKDRRRRLGAKKQFQYSLSISSAINTCTYTTPDLREMVHGSGTRRERRMLGMSVVREQD